MHDVLVCGVDYILGLKIVVVYVCVVCRFFFFQAEDGIRDLVRSRGLGDVYKRQGVLFSGMMSGKSRSVSSRPNWAMRPGFSMLSGKESSGLTSGTSPCWKAHASVSSEHSRKVSLSSPCLLYTSDAADERSSVDLGGRRIIKKKNSDDIVVAESAAITIIKKIQGKTSRNISRSR